MNIHINQAFIDFLETSDRVPLTIRLSSGKDENNLRPKFTHHRGMLPMVALEESDRLLHQFNSQRPSSPYTKMCINPQANFAAEIEFRIGSGKYGDTNAINENSQSWSTS